MNRKNSRTDNDQPSEADRAEEIRRYNLWQKSTHRKILFTAFYISLLTFPAIQLLPLLPFGNSSQNGSCSTVTNRRFEGPAASEVQKDFETTVTCTNNSIRNEQIIAGSIVIGSTLIPLLAFELGWFKISLNNFAFEGGTKAPSIPEKVTGSKNKLKSDVATFRNKNIQE